MRPAETILAQSTPAHRIDAILSARLSDERLARRIGAGDDAAFEILYRRYSTRLAAYGARLLGERARGEDVSQTTLMNAYQALLRGSQPVHVKAWLYRSARNAALEVLRRQKDAGVLVEIDVEDTNTDGHETHAARGELVTALRALPERQRHAYLLREMHGLPIKEIGERLALSAEQVEQALFAARNRLAEELAFGERLTCDAVQALDTTLLERGERRALRGHLRACPSCRSTVSAGPGLAGFLPLGLISSIRNAVGGLLGGGGAPLAVKAGAVVATAALASGGVGAATTIVGKSSAAVRAETTGGVDTSIPALRGGVVAPILARVFGHPRDGSTIAVNGATQAPSPDPGSPLTGPGPTAEPGPDASASDQATDSSIDPAAEPAPDPPAEPPPAPAADPAPSEPAPTDTVPAEPAPAPPPVEPPPPAPPVDPTPSPTPSPTPTP